MRGYVLIGVDGYTAVYPVLVPVRHFRHDMGNTWSLLHVRNIPCNDGYGMCVSLKHGVIIVSENYTCLRLYSLEDGSLVRTIGGKGSGRGQFSFTCGGLCVSPDGDNVLVADSDSGRVQEVRIADGSWVRFVGEGVLRWPEFVDCNADVIVVSEGFNRISVLSWADGSVRAQFGRVGPGWLQNPRGIRLLADGSGLVVADTWHNRLCVFGLAGNLVRTVCSQERVFAKPYDVLECTPDGGFVVTNHEAHNLVKLVGVAEAVGVDVDVDIFGKRGRDNNEFDSPTTLAVLPDGGLAVRELKNRRIQVFRGLGLRSTWITVCVIFAARK